jgi:hypothetical protein
MVDLIIYVAAAFPILAVLIAFSLLAPTWHWPVGFIAAVGGVLIWLWLDHWHATRMPHYKEGPGGGLGIALVSIWTFGFAIASTTYIAGLIWWRSRR